MTASSRMDPPSHFISHLAYEHAGQFKGMARILEEQGIDAKGLKAQCGPNFKCWSNIIPPNSPPCCCWKGLFDQPDFTNQKSRLEELGAQCGFEISFYPHFHCECNFIESNWGYAKRIYHQYPESSDEKTLKWNILNALESIPLISMHQWVFQWALS